MKYLYTLATAAVVSIASFLFFQDEVTEWVKGENFNEDIYQVPSNSEVDENEESESKEEEISIQFEYEEKE